ncbi:hypothetical protein MFLAVUS_011498 [Mucor flavus]|uniref:RING-type domain-containing protein n=1 Tax=Mucor flavus TaxID=439312 RepID=A0ABP9ZFM6_9FUNG
MNNPILLIVNSLRDELTCALCQDVFENPQSAIPCLHTFCLDCVSSIPNDEGTFACPICRSAVNHYAQGYYEVQNTPIEIIESLNIDSMSAGSSSSSVQITSAANDSNIKTPCRSCQTFNGTNYTCRIPISESQQSSSGHIFCGFCSEYLPARGSKGNEPAINQCCQNKSAKLYVLSEITSIKQYLIDIGKIDSLEDGHLNQHEIRNCRRMTPLALQLYNTRRISSGSDNEDEEEEEDTYYDRMGEEGILPSNHLLACYSCAVTIVNGQFYGYWRDALANDLARDLRDPCPQGVLCEAQWRTEKLNSNLASNRTSNEFYEYYDA